MNASIARSITRAASTQTFYTIRFLVDRELVDDGYRAYAYFRWVDDILDAEAPLDEASRYVGQEERTAFLDRQRTLLERCLQGDAPRVVSPQERMLVELVADRVPIAPGLETYLREMMHVMAFDASRRGRLISQAELDAYTRSLAVAVAEAMHYFIGRGTEAGTDDRRYLAVTGAHILHMLRDTRIDLQAGYFNVPCEWLAEHRIRPQDIDTDAYRDWVKKRVQLAATCLEAGREYYARLRNRRHRLAGLAYIARFEWLVDHLRRDGFRLQPAYDDAQGLATRLRMSALTVARTGMPGPDPDGSRWRVLSRARRR